MHALALSQFYPSGLNQLMEQEELTLGTQNEDGVGGWH